MSKTDNPSFRNIFCTQVGLNLSLMRGLGVAAEPWPYSFNLFMEQNLCFTLAVCPNDVLGQHTRPSNNVEQPKVNND